MSRENVRIAQRLNEAINRGDVAGTIELLDDEVAWWDRADDPGAGVHRGHQGYLDHRGELAADIDDLRVEAQEFIDVGDHVVVPVRVTGRGRVSEAPFVEEEVHVLKVQEGRVTELREYRGKAEALKAVGLEE